MRKPAILVGLAAALAVSSTLGLVSGPSSDAGPVAVAGDQPTEPAITRLQGAVAAAQRHDPIPDPLHPGLDGLRHDVAYVGACNYAGGRRRLCRRGAADGHKLLIELGDSHARAWIPALEDITKRSGYASYYLAKPGCTAASITPDHGEGAFVGCVEWREWAIRQIRRLRPDALVVTAAMPDGIATHDGQRVTDPVEVAERMRKGMVRTIRAVSDRVGHVFVVSDAPGLAEDAGACLSQSGSDLGSCASARSDAAQLHFAADRAAARQTRVRFVDTRPWFCSDHLCPAVVGKTITYRDDGHMTTVYSRSLGWALQHAMRLAQLRP